MKKATKIKIIAILFIPLSGLISIIFIMALLLLGSNDIITVLADSAYDNPERIEELMRLKAFGIPIDIIMMVTTYNSETEEEALQKPFIFPALEFLIMTEEVKEYTHHHDDDKSPTDDDYHSSCGYETAEINTYEYKDKIKSYLGITDEESSSLNAGNLIELAQAAADERCSSTQIRIISFEAIWFMGYEDAIRRCGVENENDLQNIFELHKKGYFLEWLDSAANSIGMNPGESAVIGGSTHNAIRQALQRPDLTDLFFGGLAILPLQSGTYRITSEFGPRDYPRDPNHTGLDFSAAAGTPIYSVMDGIILMRVTNMNTFGHHIVIYHGGKVTTMYAHMSAFGSFKPGDRVSQGDVIGYVGTTGLSEGNHLHFEYQKDGYAYNPRLLLPLG